MNHNWLQLIKQSIRFRHLTWHLNHEVVQKEPRHSRKRVSLPSFSDLFQEKFSSIFNQSKKLNENDNTEYLLRCPFKSKDVLFKTKCVVLPLKILTSLMNSRNRVRKYLPSGVFMSPDKPGLFESFFSGEGGGVVSIWSPSIFIFQEELL